MLKKKAIDPFVVGFVVTILIVSALILSGPVNAEKSIIKNVNYEYSYDEYDQNINSHDEYSYKEYDSEDNNRNHNWNMLSI